ncbi:MAG: glycosyltransferase family 39 protein [Gammaproteobacteria bacterium]
MSNPDINSTSMNLARNRLGMHKLYLAGLWLSLILTALFTRTLWPIDETRYASVAWEMWLRGDFLVPYLNGEPYSHKPPLMFWLFQAGWWVFGVNEWWPRLVPPLFALGNLFLTARLARLLWPPFKDPLNERVARHAPLILLGCLVWTFFTTVTLFDMLLTFFTLLGLLGVLHARQQGGLRGWLILGVAIGLGVLSKGPVILLHLLPVTLLAPWWVIGAGRVPNWKLWYGGLVCAVLLGAGIALAWAIPAAQSGGPAYAHAIFWGQTADRLVASFAHRHLWWWYVPMLPVFLFPWSLWPPLWRGFKQLWIDSRQTPDTGVRFCLAWLLPTFIVLSVISGKQVHYLLPLLPAFALLASYAVFREGGDLRPKDAWLPGMGLVLTGLALSWVSYLAQYFPQPGWATLVLPLAGFIVACIGIMLIMVPEQSRRQGVTALSISSVVLIVMIHLSVARVAAPTLDLRAIGSYLHSLQEAGYPIAHVNSYYGQYQFVGRLHQPLQVIARHEIVSWIEAHPQGRVIIYSGDSYPRGAGKPEYTHPYRGLTFSVWSRAALLMNGQP